MQAASAAGSIFASILPARAKASVAEPVPKTPAGLVGPPPRPGIEPSEHESRHGQNAASSGDRVDKAGGESDQRQEKQQGEGHGTEPDDSSPAAAPSARETQISPPSSR